MTDMTNYYRWLLGVNPYQTVSSHHKSLQEFAVIENLYIKKVGNLSHHPTTDGKFEKPGDMSEEFWSSGATLNNIIAAGSAPQKSIEQWFTEGYNRKFGVFDTTGHRDLLLSYKSTGMTFSFVNYISVSQKIGGGTIDLPCSVFPAPGAFPNTSLEPEHTAWSIELNPNQLRYDLDNICVKVTNLNTNESYECTKENKKISTLTYGYGIAYVQPEISTTSYENSYKIEISGLTDTAGNEKVVVYQTDPLDIIDITSSNVVSIDCKWSKVHEGPIGENNISYSDFNSILPREITYLTDKNYKGTVDVLWGSGMSGYDRIAHVSSYHLPEGIKDSNQLIKN